MPRDNPDHLFLKQELYIKEKYMKGAKKVII